MSIRLIVNADDFGIHEDANLGVIRSFRQGIVRSTSIIASGRGFEHAVKLAHEEPALGVGVHLTLVEERPVLPPEQVRSLVNSQGTFFQNYKELFKKSYQLDDQEVLQEWCAQVQKVIDAGISPTHLDSHQHVHVFPKYFKIAKRVAEKFGIRSLRAPAESWSDAIAGGVGNLGLATLGRVSKLKITRAGLSRPPKFWGARYSGHLVLGPLKHILMRLQPGTHELMCHPAQNTESFRSQYSWSNDLEQEVLALTHPEVLALIRDRGIELISYREI